MSDERLEHEDSVLARYRKLPKPEPSAALDAAILAQARAAVSGSTSPRVQRRRSRWPALFATAATLALAVGVSWQMRQAEQARQPVLEGVPVPQASREEVAKSRADTGPAADATVASSANAVGELKQQRADDPDERESVVVSGSRLERSQADSARERQAAAPKPAAPAEPEPAAASAPVRRPEPSPEIVFDEPLPMAEPVPFSTDDQPAPAEQPESRETASPPAPPPPPAPVISAPAQSAPPAAAAAPFRDGAADAEADDAFKLEESSPADDVKRDAERGREHMRKESAADAPAPAGASAGASAGARNALGASAAQIDPVDPVAERELDRIERLIARKRIDAARRALATFRREHPGYPIPRAITDALD